MRNRVTGFDFTKYAMMTAAVAASAALAEGCGDSPDGARGRGGAGGVSSAGTGATAGSRPGEAGSSSEAGATSGGEAGSSSSEAGATSGGEAGATSGGEAGSSSSEAGATSSGGGGGSSGSGGSGGGNTIPPGRLRIEGVVHQVVFGATKYLPLSGASVRVHGDSTVATTDMLGRFVLEVASTTRVLLDVTGPRQEKEHWSYGSTQQVIDVSGNLIKPVVVLGRGCSWVVSTNPTSSGYQMNCYEAGNQMRFTYKGEAIVDDETKLPFTGDMIIDMFAVPRALDNNLPTASLLWLMPGNFKARKKDGAVVGLKSFGAAEVRLTDKATGRKLQVAAGKTVTVSFQTLSSATVAEAAPWRYDEDTAEWIEEGTGTLTGGRYDIQAGHLSWWNCDRPDPAPRPGESEGGGGGCTNGWNCINAFCTCSQEPTPAGIDPSAGKVPGCVRGRIDFPTAFTPSDSLFSMFVTPLNSPRVFAGNIRVAADGTFCTPMPGSYPFQLHNPTRGANATCPNAVIPAANTPLITPGPFGFGAPDPSCGGGGCEDLGTLAAFCALS